MITQLNLLDKVSPDTREIRFGLSERDMSNFRGLNNMNISAIKKLYPRTNLIVESNIRTKAWRNLRGNRFGEIFYPEYSGN